ncbi:LacI family DNA-binding transcriptional regulator [Actinoplanes awajinensis]|uniref:LacI family transcriptional regulator n=1 Tax=Actinoplanes awajinensis subsp. mycoplanecinus TaxID=135947 RepID=A0A101J714_9ACTN|nr:LacI family DNA-binding transcriptional regulator [Actinoplanes awajinensis]KUL21424.1 LacI family transcriptional regulator [Actinoplanes awajinensis subsp. mycoplanecinus]
MKRATIADIARLAGVSKSQVSYAVNGRPGVAEPTRQRILAIAEEAGFRANSSARALAGGPSRVVGLALRRPAQTLAVEPFFMELVGGLEAELSAHGFTLLLQMVADERAETALYQQWAGDRRVDGVLICDTRVDDGRPALVTGLALPAVVIGPPVPGGSPPSVWSDDARPMTEAVEYLAALGHRRIARIAGLRELAHTAVRTAAFERICAERGLTETVLRWTDYTAESGADATRELLSTARRPTALIYDNDIMAVAGLAVAQELGLAVPMDLSVIAWDDSPICALVHPTLTALAHDIGAYGAQAARRLLGLLAGQPITTGPAEPAHLVPRGSTAPPPAG